MPGLPLFCEVAIFGSRQYVLSGISFKQEGSRTKLYNYIKNNIRLFFNVATIGKLIFYFNLQN